LRWSILSCFVEQHKKKTKPSKWNEKFKKMYGESEEVNEMLGNPPGGNFTGEGDCSECGVSESDFDESDFTYAAAQAAVAGKKAFKTITSVAASAAATDFFVGTGDVFGLPIRANARNYVLTAWGSAFVTTGTFTGADATTATTTTGDVRGTFAPADAADASKRLTLWVFVLDDDTQTGLYGVTQA
jgi:hypothetical protein